MSIMKQVFMWLFIVFALTGCKDKYSYSYLTQHPAVLKQEIANCQAKTEKTEKETEQCDTVMYAAANLMSLLNEQQSDPEKFGQRIMDQEVAYAKTKTALHQATKTLQTLEEKRASGTEWQAAQDERKKLQKTCEEQRQELKILLAVMGMSSPE